MEVDPDLKPNKTTKFLLEFDRRLRKNWAFKIRGVYSSSKNLMEDLALYDPEKRGKFVFADFELKKRDYRALEVELNGRVASKFMVRAAYTRFQVKETNQITGESGELGRGLAWAIASSVAVQGGAEIMNTESNLISSRIRPS
ncbi:MAG: hypothetical protein JW902_19945 [Syntrophaceae bacterium]|nr:hypothetical protein [Syntrophaceae bacterium]